jgi:deoxyribonuclease IV
MDEDDRGRPATEASHTPGNALDSIMPLGAHVPTAGGLDRAPEHGGSVGADAIQIFTRNQLQWRARPIAAREARAFRTACAQHGLRSVCAHGSYLLNLASPDRALLQQSRVAFVAEIRRCQALGIPDLIFHPGAHKGCGVEGGVATVAESLGIAIAKTPKSGVRLLIEITAGQGTCLGGSIEQLAAILAAVEQRERAGVCLDTCHLYAAGYDLVSSKGYEAVFEACEQQIGLDRLGAMHLNDTRSGLGSHLDRHAPLGTGRLGRVVFSRIVRDPRLARLPLILETPGGLPAWRREIRLLRRWAGKRA